MKCESVFSIQGLSVLLFCWFVGCGSHESDEPTALKPSPTSAPAVAAVQNTPTATPTPTLDETVIAQLPGEAITYERLRRYMDAQKALMMSHMAGKDDLRPYLVDQLEKKTNEVIENWLLLREAQRNEVPVSPEEFEGLLSKMKSMYDEEQFKANLRSLDQMGAGAEVLLTNFILINKMRTRLQEQFRDEITPEVKKAWYDEHVDDKFTRPQVSRIRRVSLLHGEDQKRTPEEAKAKLRELRDQVVAEFETIKDATARNEIMVKMARKHSETPDRRGSGYHIVYHVDKAIPHLGAEFLETVAATPKGKLSDIVPIPGGYTFFYVLQHIHGEVIDYESDSTQKLLEPLIIQEKFDQWEEQKRREYGIAYHRDRLEECVDEDLDDAMEALRAAQPIPTMDPGRVSSATDLPLIDSPDAVATPSSL